MQATVCGFLPSLLSFQLSTTGFQIDPLLSYPLLRKIISQSRIAEEDKANTSCGSLVSDNSLISCCLQDRMGFPGGSVVKNLSVKQETQVQSLKVKLLSHV